MKNLIALQAEKNITPEIRPVNLCWVDNPSVQKLLDVISSIIADEYIQTAKQNPQVFKNGGQK